MAEVFVVYEPGDVQAARALSLSLAPHSVFVADDDIAPGEDVDTFPAQRAARITVALLRRAPRLEHGVRAAIALAIELAKEPELHRLVPVYMDGRPDDLSRIPYGLWLKQGIDAQALPGGMAAVADALRRVLEQPGAAAQQRVEQPFRVLHPFGYEDASLFFGREVFAQELASSVDETRLCVLHGASGSGKSSLLEAGLRPRVTPRYCWLAVLPDSDLLASITRAARAALVSLQIEPHGERASDLLLLLARSKPVLLVLDQLEELFQRRSEEEIRATVSAVSQELLRCLNAGFQLGEVHVLFSVRGDYFGHLSYFRQAGLPVFSEELLLRPLERTQARLAIEEPLRRAGFSIARELVRTLTDDLAQRDQQVRPVELEIVCHELLLAARKSDVREISDALYDALGGAGKVLGIYLRRALDAVAASDKDVAGRLLRAMVSAGGLRHEPQEVAALAAGAGASRAAVERVLQHLVGARLVETSEAAATYRLAHDLVAAEVYATLNEDEKRNLVLRERLRQHTADWLTRGRKGLSSRFVADSDRRQLLGVMHELRGLDAAQDAFLAALEQHERSTRRRNRLLGVAAALLGIGGAVALSAAAQRYREVQADRAVLQGDRDVLREERALLQADRFVERDPGVALAWLNEAVALRGSASPRHLAVAIRALQGGVGAVIKQVKPEMESQLDFSPGCDEPTCWPQRKWLAFSDRRGIEILDLPSKRRFRLQLPATGPARIVDVAFTPDGKELLALAHDGERKGALINWDLANGHEPSAAWPFVISLDEPHRFLHISRTGRYVLAVHQWGGTLFERWRWDEPHPINELMWMVALSDFDDDRAAILSPEIALLNLATRAKTPVVAAAGFPARAATFDRSGKLLISGNGYCNEHQTSAGPAVQLATVLPPYDKPMQCVEAPETLGFRWVNDELFTARVDGTLSGPRGMIVSEVQKLGHADSGSLLWARIDGTIAAYDPRRDLRRELRGNRGGVVDLALSPGAELAAAVDREGTVRLWQVDLVPFSSPNQAVLSAEAIECDGKPVVTRKQYEGHEYVVERCVADAIVGHSLDLKRASLFHHGVESPIDLPGEGILNLAHSPDRRTLAVMRMPAGETLEVAARKASEQHDYLVATWPRWQFERRKGPLWLGPATLGADGLIYYVQPGKLLRIEQDGARATVADLPSLRAPVALTQSANGQLFAIGEGEGRLLLVTRDASTVEVPGSSTLGGTFVDADSAFAFDYGGLRVALPPSTPEALERWLKEQATWDIVGGSVAKPRPYGSAPPGVSP